MNPPKSPGVAALASFLWPGAGFIYCGRFGLFVAWFFGSVALVCVMFFFALALVDRAGPAFLWLVYALALCIRFAEIMLAYRCAEDYNRRLAGEKMRRSRGRSGGRRSRKIEAQEEDLDALKARLRDLEAAQVRDRIERLEGSGSVGGPVEDVDPGADKAPKRSSLRDRAKKRRRRR